MEKERMECSSQSTPLNIVSMLHTKHDRCHHFQMTGLASLKNTHRPQPLQNQRNLKNKIHNSQVKVQKRGTKPIN